MNEMYFSSSPFITSPSNDPKMSLQVGILSLHSLIAIDSNQMSYFYNMISADIHAQVQNMKYDLMKQINDSFVYPNTSIDPVEWAQRADEQNRAETESLTLFFSVVCVLSTKQLISFETHKAIKGQIKHSNS